MLAQVQSYNSDCRAKHLAHMQTISSTVTIKKVTVKPQPVKLWLAVAVAIGESLVTSQFLICKRSKLDGGKVQRFMGIAPCVWGWSSYKATKPD